MLRLAKVWPDVELCLLSLLARSPPKWTALLHPAEHSSAPHGLEEIMYARKPVKVLSRDESRTRCRAVSHHTKMGERKPSYL